MKGISLMSSNTGVDKHGRDVLQELAPEGRALRALIPDVYSAFADLSKAAQAPGALSAIEKELIALAIAVSRQCDGCIASHARSLVMKGATEEQVAEALGVCIQMMGGPGTVYGPRAFAAFKSFSTPQSDHSNEADKA
ncbi:MAG: carboxymuconolactone decarboxylase family protein [Actinobacteria bacterium]|nr:carboxymuconolactone decarboxylase family protein [Actinomycetota bacterium]